MNFAYFSAKIYKVVSGSETFVGTNTFYIPFDDSITAQQGSSYQELPAAALNSVNLVHGLTYFFIDLTPTFWDTRMKSAHGVATDFGKGFDLTPFAGNILRIKIDDHRRIDISVSTITQQSNAAFCRLGYTFYYDNRVIASFSNYTGCEIASYNMSSASPYSTFFLPGLIFPSPDGTKICRGGALCNDRWNVEDEKYDATYNANTWTQSMDLRSFITGFEPSYVDPDNPYGGGGISDEGGGDGNFSEDSDDPSTDDLPTIDAVGTGMATIFTPDRSQLRALSALFWNSNVFTFLQNLVENITNMFISLAMVPFRVTAGSTVSVTWLGIDTAVSLTLAAKQFYEIDMGTIDLANDSRIFTSGSALDYAPFSSLGIYLPFIGYRDLDIDECREAGVNLRYRLDILSGSCVAIVKVGGKDIYEFTGNCLTQIPITNENMQSLVSDAVNIGLAVANAESAGAVASGVEADAIAAGEPLTAEKSAHMDQMVGRSRGQLASATANAAMGMKPNFAKTGAVSGSVAMMSVKQPYLFLKTPRQSIPDHYQRYCGFPSNISGKLGDFSGYTVVEDIRLNGLVATSPEVAEIYKLLKSGVII